MSKDKSLLEQIEALEVTKRIVLDVTGLRIKNYGKVIDGVYTDSTTHVMAIFTYKGKEYAKPCFRKNAPETGQVISRAQLEVTETNDEHVFSVRDISVDPLLLSKQEIAMRSNAVHLDW